MSRDAFSMALLFDFYGELLTEKQRDYFDLYYNQDLSLAEIAENEGVSRQGVYDALSRAEAALRNYEDKTGCVARSMQCHAAAQSIAETARQVAALPGGAPLAEKLEKACAGLKE